ncbi:spore gernimation protein [Paenibacillus protaetiae]|uniref:Spore gernimation protein n=2 Tax=Paenibacillus protaetiae TaxID=2509456 RepID=A0A4P6EZZ5_9BACL|nr:spore gernimation protein [Paenibacillus protaetiae]
MIFALMNGLFDHVIINPMLLDASGRDAWIAVLVTGFFFVLWSFLIVWFMRRTGQRKWQEWLSTTTHPVVSWIFIVPLCAILYCIGGTTVINTVKWNITNYLPATSGFALSIALIAICFVLAFWGIRVIAISGGILLPIVTMLGIFVSTFNTPEKDHRLLKPILEHGWGPVADGILYAAGGYVEIILVVLLQHRVSSKLKVWQMLIFALFTIVIMLGPITGAIMEFGPVEASEQMISPYEQWRLVRIGQYIEHVDFFSIFQWLSGACVRISVAAYLIVDILPLTKKNYRLWGIALIMVSYIVTSMLPINDYKFYLWMLHFYMPVSFVLLFGMSLVWMGIALFTKPLRKDDNNNGQRQNSMVGAADKGNL